VSVALLLLSMAAGLFLATTPEPTWMRLLAVAVVGGLLATLSVPLLKRLLLAVILLDLPLQVDRYLQIDDLATAENAVIGFNVSVTTIALLLLYVLWGIEALGWQSLSVRWRPALPTLAYVAAVVISVLFAEEVRRSMFEIVLLGHAVLLFCYLLHVVRDGRDVIFVIAWLMVDLVLQGVLTVGAGILGVEAAVGPVEVRSLGERVGGTIGHPNTLGAFLIMLLPVALAGYTTLPTKGQQLSAGAAFGLGMVALVLTASRGAWVGAVLSLAIFAFVGRRHGWLRGKTVALLATSGLIVVAVSWPQIAARLAEYDNAAAQARLPLMTLASQVIGQSPIFGVGINNFAVAMKDYLTVDLSNAWISTVHNKYLLVWGETGIIGLLAFLWVLISALRTGFGGRHWSDPMLGSLAVAFASALLAGMVHMSVAIYHSRPHTQMIWLVVGMIAALSNINATTTPAESYTRMVWMRAEKQGRRTLPKPDEKSPVAAGGEDYA
jgi:O-antigen ligase